jgi:hypothetical protein
MVSFGICNTLLSAKKQHIRALKENFDTQSAAFMENKARGVIEAFQADLQTLPIIKVPTDILQKQVFESLSVGGRPLSLTTTLSQTADGLNLAIEKRNESSQTTTRLRPRSCLPYISALPPTEGASTEFTRT